MTTVKSFSFDNANRASVARDAQEYADAYVDDYAEDGMQESDAAIKESPDYIGEGANRIRYGGSWDVRVSDKFAE